MNRRQELIEAYPDYEFTLPDGFDDAIIGVVETGDEPRVVYSVSKCIEIIMKRDDMNEDDAFEHFEYNVRGTRFDGEPIWVEDGFLGVAGEPDAA